MSATIERRFHFATQGNRRGGFRRVLRQGSAPEPAPPPPPAAAAAPCASPPEPATVHPLARRMAMAIRCQQLIDSGVVGDQAAVAAVAGMTRAWVTVVMRLNLLAPDLQEALLFLPPEAEVDHRAVQRITMRSDWAWQRRQWRSLALGAGLAAPKAPASI